MSKHFALATAALIFVSIISQNLMAGEGGPSVAICPALTEDGQNIISSIQTLRDELKKQPECASIDEKLKNVSEILNSNKWAEVKALLRGQEAPALEGKDVEELSALIHAASKNASEVVASLSGNGGLCVVKDDKRSFLSRFSGIVREVSSVAGSITGPYGMAVTVGGQFLSSALMGIENLLPNKSYNFQDSLDETLFMNQYCSFSEIHKDINDYVGLDLRQQELTELNRYLDLKIDDLKNRCPECHGYAIAWETKEVSDKVIGAIRARVNVMEAGNDLNANHYSRCTDIHREFHTADSHLMNFVGILRDYRNPYMSSADAELISEVIVTTEALSSHYPTLNQCSVLPPEQKVSVARDFNNFMRDEIIPLNDEVFGLQMQTFQYVADKKYCSPLGEYTDSSLNRKKWIARERDRVNGKLNDPNYATTTAKIREAREEIEQRFVRELLPRYLSFIVKRNLKTIENFIDQFKGFKKIEKKVNGYDPRVLLAERSRMMDGLKLALDQTRTFNRYCEHLRYLLLATGDSEKVCHDGRTRLTRSYSALSQIDETVGREVQSANLWIKNDQIYQISRVNEYVNKIKEWNDRGESRWLLKTDRDCYQP